MLDQSLAGFRRAFGEDHAETAATKLWRARGADDLPPAAVERLLAEAATTFERSASDDPRSIDAFNAYANELQASGRFPEAREWLDRSAAAAERLFGDALATEMLRNYARLEFARGDAAAAERLSRRALARELERCAARPGIRPGLVRAALHSPAGNGILR